MKLLVVTCLLALAASSRADGILGAPEVYAPGHASVDYYAYPRYAFDYSVNDPHTGDNKAQWEKRDGDVVKGAYSLVEPDGTLRVVEYYADDKSGFNAVVKRLGHSAHPTTVHGGESIYKAAIPTLGLGSEGIGPISVGPVAGYSGLAHAPLLKGPIFGGATSSVSIKRDPGPVIRPVANIIAPYIKSAPILASLPEARAPYNPYYAPVIRESEGPLGGPLGILGRSKGYLGSSIGPLEGSVRPWGGSIGLLGGSIGPLGPSILPKAPLDPYWSGHASYSGLGAAYSGVGESEQYY